MDTHEMAFSMGAKNEISNQEKSISILISSNKVIKIAVALEQQHIPRSCLYYFMEHFSSCMSYEAGTRATRFC